MKILIEGNWSGFKIYDDLKLTNFKGGDKNVIIIDIGINMIFNLSTAFTIKALCCMRDFL